MVVVEGGGEILADNFWHTDYPPKLVTDER